MEACQAHMAGNGGRHSVHRIVLSGTWLHVRNERARCPEQGWKLHIAAGLSSATAVLQQALPLLLAEDVDFKLAASPADLAALNDGDGGLAQVGKFLTVYPNDDTQLVRLARILDDATRGLRGPRIPSDRPLRPGSIVHYRYGGSGDRVMQTHLGEVVPALETPTGELVPDRRIPNYEPPSWTVDPLLMAGIAQELPACSPLTAGRYLVVTTLHRSARGAVHVAVDTETLCRCVLKQAHRDAQLTEDGTDARDRLRREAEILDRLAPDARCPKVIDVVEHEDDLYLVLEHVVGETLGHHLALFLARGTLPASELIVTWGRELVTILSDLHGRGVVYRDLKASNVIVEPDGHLRLVDFDLAYDQLSSLPPLGRGTPGYMSPQQALFAPPELTDDVYSLGALLFLLTTGVEPSRAAQHSTLLKQQLSLLNPRANPQLGSVIVRCLAPAAADRYNSLVTLDADLAKANFQMSLTPPLGGEAVFNTELDARRRWAELAWHLGDSLAEAAERAEADAGVYWRSQPHLAGGIVCRDVNSGVAGTLLALAELVAAFDEPEQRRALAEGARWLAMAPRPGGQPPVGLYVGDAGVGTALLRAGQILGDERLIKAAADRGDFVASALPGSPDLFSGIAGCVRFHLLLWDELGNPDHLTAAVVAGQRLLAMAEDVGKGMLRWVIPPGYDGMSGQAYLGYAHGAAGIADALLDLFEATEDDRFLVASRAAGRWLIHLAVPTLDDGSGLNWPEVEGQRASRCFWCHGAAGIGRFWLHASAINAIPEAASIAAAAARMVAHGARWIGPTQCHGLAGNIEFLLDMFQATSDPNYVVEARSLGHLLEAFSLDRDGMIVPPWMHSNETSPDYMVGYAGVATCLLRLSDPHHQYHLLSRRGFRNRPASE
jgi:tRNA A-37 threonylcarbamoyl transferase component Bud32